MNCNSVTLAAFSHGWGRHKKHLLPRQIQICLILHWVFQITYKMAVAMNKASILLLYLRIMPQRYYRILIYSLLTIVGLFAISTTIAGIFQCIPVDKAWNKKKPGHCYNLVNAWYTNAVFSITTDFLILMLPMHMVYKLQRDMREKFLLYCVFGLGFFVTFTSIMRFFALKSAKNPDTTYDITSGFWSVIEINVGVICICLPPLRALLSRQFSFFNRSRSRVTGSSKGGPYNHSAGKAGEAGIGSSAPSELVTIGGSGGRGTRERKGDPESSEEELVYMGGSGGRGIGGGGIGGGGRRRGSVRGGLDDRKRGGSRSGELNMDMDLEGGFDRGIMKKTEFKVTERSRSREAESDKELDAESVFGELERPWERIPHAR
ncbi:hypothetical protein ONS96_006024 [Cadophora gregata f. sp. sojae]|nr:hypothetical protein ONS96_006024 [Cadophora gregata f. sp. sojae]